MPFPLLEGRFPESEELRAVHLCSPQRGASPVVKNQFLKILFTVHNGLALL